MSRSVLDRLAEEHQAHGHRSFQLAIAFGRPVPDPDEVREHLQQIIDGLVVHMASEEENLFPWIRTRVPVRAPDLEMLAGQHLQIALLVAEFEIALRRGDRHPFSERIDTAKAFVRLLDHHTSVELELVRLAQSGAR